jgi:5-methylcytosine-specific restriction protein B
MINTLLTRISKLDQYNRSKKTIVWEDKTTKRWDNVYSKLKVGDNAILISKDITYIGVISKLNSTTTINVEEIKELIIKNDELLQLDEIYPELISRVKANFQPFIHEKEINIPKLIENGIKQKFIGYYIFNSLEDYEKRTINLNLSDRILILNNGAIENIQVYNLKKLIIAPFNKLLNSSGKTLKQLLKITEKYKGKDSNSNNVKRLRDILIELKSEKYYKFKTFFSYHDTLYNLRIYGTNPNVENWEENHVSELITLNIPLNQILYGPPGTGKTYHTVLEAAKIITCNETISYDDALSVFNSHLNKQIEFITFHQNYSYEDFIQGIRPDTENGSALTFEKKDGVFKRIADRALKNLDASKNPATARKDFDFVFQELIKPLNDADVEELEIKMKKSSFYITEVGEKSIEFRKNIGDSQHTLSINTLRKMYEKGINDLILGGLQPYYNPILELLLEKGKSNVQSVKKENFVIIIDEINRANISRVFGELITLIEEDKRSHGKIPMRVTLPSGDSFIVPSNLYIIGTMNTADKSIALLDIALRRRFEFVPMYPDATLEAVHDKEILAAINKAILDRKNHDFTIGHAYFMGDDYSRVKTINNKVIPLLLEYFMNDEKEVKAILQSAQLTVDGWPLKLIS